ncbi:MAG: hydantoinase/oxoprolinase family protein [Rhizobiaceae bacterium]
MLKRDIHDPILSETGENSSPLLLGIDTGGTYTDAVLFSEEAGIVAKAKALTTRHDLSVGIAGAAEAVIAETGVSAARIGLVSMSTTLATNALVEGQGGRVALVMIGFDEGDLSRDGLRQALGGDPLIVCAGGHDVHGNPRLLDLAPLQQALEGPAGDVAGFAVAAYFAVRNPAHEIAAHDMIRQATGLPVTCSHALSTRLGGPRRALTTLLNARLVPMIDRLIASTRRFMDKHAIAAPLMVVRGDGALIASELAVHRPIETILSGPAASLVGARHITGLDNAVVSDIGGTTTDVAVLDGGRPRLDPEGAIVGGHRTMVEAVAMRTYGLGGDSEVMSEEGALEPDILLGPRRLVPLALAAAHHGAAVTEVLERQLRAANPGRLDGRFAIRTGIPGHHASGLAASEAKLYAGIGDAPTPLDRLLSSTTQNATLSRLVARGLVHVIGFTPSDAAHVLDRQRTWNRDAAELGARLFARRRTGRGLPLAADAAEISKRVLATLTRRSAEVVLETALCEGGLDGPALVAGPLVQRALDRRAGIVRSFLALDRPVVGLGASAPLHYAGLGALLGGECVVPPDTDVANAVGAVAGRVRVSLTAVISQPREGLFRVSVGEEVRDFADEDAASEFAEERLRELVAARAVEAGTDAAVIGMRRDDKAATIEGRRMFVEARLVATASGRPRVAV